MLAAALLGSLEPVDRLVLQGGTGPGRGKHVVLLAGDEEYRSEEALPQLARILSQRHGFKCTVLFSQNEKGEIDPTAVRVMPGLSELTTADLVVMMLRFRQWGDEDMKRFEAYWKSGKPLVAIRTSTHAFNFPADSPWRSFSWNSSEGGFGRQVLGETWLTHWGNHGSQATRGVVSLAGHPVMRGVKDVFGPTDVYEAHPPADATILMRGEVVAGMAVGDPAAIGSKRTVKGVEQGLNSPMMPIAWTRELALPAGVKQRVFTTTMGDAVEVTNEGFRRMLVNAVYWGLKMERSIKPGSDVGLVGDYSPSRFGFGGYRKGVKVGALLSR